MACPSEPVAKACYFEKIKAIGGRDPYKIAAEEFSIHLDDLPEITYPDIFSYLGLEHSKYTADESKVKQTRAPVASILPCHGTNISPDISFKESVNDRDCILPCHTFIRESRLAKSNCGCINKSIEENWTNPHSAATD
ncbi:hypothetical protein PoB_003966800 [Plakobranchus ocellatus]|uniref:Uncharacterized protein n=1 Tax=Plakobranchus ocellatus TaxID=259542 RepID=A0AAV4B0T7_9GAST|nr:hypothetical protein PoB_003966800 [Plakobranchus ocellatus]